MPAGVLIPFIYVSECEQDSSSLGQCRSKIEDCDVLALCRGTIHKASIPPSGQVGLTCSLLVIFWANFLSQRASSVSGSISTSELVDKERQARRSILTCGFEIKSTVCEGLQGSTEWSASPHSVSEASAVSSKTLTLTSSLTPLFLFGTSHCQKERRYSSPARISPFFLAPILFTQTCNLTSSSS